MNQEQMEEPKTMGEALRVYSKFGLNEIEIVTNAIILVRMHNEHLAELIQLKAVNMNKELIAKACHEANKAYCESIGDNSQPSWEDAPQWQKDSAINGVDFHLNNDTTPEQSHVDWMKQKELDGWVYGEVKDADKKTHPCMVPYNQLPIEQRSKDYIFSAIVHAFK